MRLALLLLIGIAVCAQAQSFAGSYCGTTPNGVLTLNFTFPAPSSYIGNASFQMVDFGIETFPVCPYEPYQFVPCNSLPERLPPRGSLVHVGQITFAFELENTGCMATQLQWMWITGFVLDAYSTSWSSPVVEQFVMTVGAYEMTLTQCL